jgi:hypothetical protein
MHLCNCQWRALLSQRYTVCESGDLRSVLGCYVQKRGDVSEKDPAELPEFVVSIVGAKV